MRYHTLFYAGLVPAVVLAQSAPSTGTGFTHPTGGVASKNESATWYKPVPISHSSSKTMSNLKPSEVPSINSTIIIDSSTSTSNPSEHPHAPFTKSTGLFFTNTTSSFAQPTAKAAHISGTASASGHLPYTKGASAFFSNSTSAANPTGTGISHPSGTGAPVSVSGTGRSPFSKGTSAFLSSGTIISTHPSGTGASSGFAKPTAAGNPTKLAHNATASASTSGRLPFSKGAHFVNGTSTSAAALASGTDVSHASGTGASGFAKPTAVGNLTSHALNTTVSVSASARRPFTKGAGAFFGNTTSSNLATETRAFYPTGTAVSSGFAKPTAAGNYTAPSTNRTASGRIPYTKSGVLFLNSTVTVLPTGVASKGLISTGIVPTASAHLPYTKSKGAFFSNSTSRNPILSTGVFSSGSLPTRILSTGIPSNSAVLSGRPLYTKSSGALFLNSTASTQVTALSTGVFPTGNVGIVSSLSSSQTPVTTSSEASSLPVGTGIPFTKSAGAFFTNSTSSSAPTLSSGISTPITASSAAALNSTAIALPSSSLVSSSFVPLISSSASNSKTRKPHHAQTVTVTVTAAPVTITQAGTTKTEYTTIIPSTPVAISSILASSTGSSSSADETTTVTVVQSLSSALPTAFISSSSVASNTASSDSSVLFSGAPTTLATFPVSASPTSTFSSAATASAVVIPEFYQCGGLNWTGSGACSKGTVCKYWNPYYSQCVDERSA